MHLHVNVDQGNSGNSIQRDNNQGDNILAKVRQTKNMDITTLAVATIFSFLILISYFADSNDSQIFTKWDTIDAFEIVQLAAGIMLCYFIPGYVVVFIIFKKYKINPILRVLMGYLLSILITGLSAYISVLVFDTAISESKDLFIVIYLIILASFLISFLRYKSEIPVRVQFKSHFCYQYIISLFKESWKNIKLMGSELLVFASLFTLIIISTYVLFGGITIGDQWYHQGRSLLFMSGSFREAAISNADVFYPPFQSAMLAALTTISGIPLVNSYASIAFLNAIPMFAFYYLFSRWIPTMSKAGLLVCSLFTLSSGFGWIYLLSTIESYDVVSQGSSLYALRTVGHLDIVSTSNFVLTTGPDFSTGLIYIALPAGFLLLVLVRSRFPSMLISISSIVTITVLGMISHYEFYFFIIIASLLPVIFKMKERNYIYITLLMSLSAVYFLDSITPGDYLTAMKILEYPLLLLVGILVSITWVFYLVSNSLRKYLESKVKLFDFLRKALHYDNNKRGSFKLITVTAIIFLVTYLYLLSFVVLAELSLDTVRDHTSEGTIPWYLYPMKLGVAGILGLAFILSILSKKFEKEVLVFGVIILIAIFTGPYYNEGRFSKYVMIGMVGFASLMLHRILLSSFRMNAFRNIAIISTVIVFSGLSILIFVGYNSLILQTQDFIDTLPRRHFPSMEEINLFELLYNHTDINSNKYNIVSLPNQYNRWEDGFMSKVSSFAGLPYDKLRQSPLSLNASTLDKLYRDLSYSDTRYILLPKHDIDRGLSEPTRFAIHHFNQVYGDNNYIVLEVPEFAAPTSSPTTEVGLVYNEKHGLFVPSTEDIRVLQYDNKTFNLKDDDQSARDKKQSQTYSLDLVGSNRKNSITVWSKDLPRDPITNSIESIFRVTLSDENKNNNYVGLKWREGDNEYFMKFLDSGLELHGRTTTNQNFKLLSSSSEIEKINSIWYKVNIESIGSSINIYVNGARIIEVPKTTYENAQGITRIGLSSFHNNAEFKPIKIWNISKSSHENENKTKYFDYDYPLSILALSKAKYDVYRMGDLSVLSKDTIIVSDDKMIDNNTINTYFEYARSGGTLVVVNSDNNFSRTLSNFYSINSSQSIDEPFSRIFMNSNQNNQILVNLHGVVKTVETSWPPELNITASYRNSNNELIAPFAIEKNFSKGKIVLLNAGAYFNSLSNLSKQYFYSLSNLSNLLSINVGTAPESQNTSVPMKGIIGDLEALGQITINSSSLELPEDSNNPNELNATTITILNKIANSSITMNNTVIKNLKLNGRYDVLINLTGTMKLPGMNSKGNYFSLFIPNNFDMAVQLHPETSSSMEFFATSNNVTDSIKVTNNSSIELRGLKSASSLNYTPALMKKPQIIVQGNTSINNANFNGYLTGTGALDGGMELNVKGALKAKFDFVDHYQEHSNDVTNIKYISYLDTIEMDGVTYPKQESLKLPGDISSSAAKNGQDIPLTKITTSTINIVTLIVLILIALIVIWFTRFSNTIKRK